MFKCLISLLFTDYAERFQNDKSDPPIQNIIFHNTAKTLNIVSKDELLNVLMLQCFMLYFKSAVKEFLNKFENFKDVKIKDGQFSDIFLYLIIFSYLSTNIFV